MAIPDFQSLMLPLLQRVSDGRAHTNVEVTKRWPENTVGRPVVQAFAGSMEGFRARKGAFITTSSFSRDAQDYVSRTERKIVLIDGKQLAEFMIDHNVGVTTAQTFAVKRLDLDYFLEEEQS